MSYSKEVMQAIKDIRGKIEECTDPVQAIELQSDLLEIIQNTLLDTKFKEDLISRTPEENT